MKARFLLVVAGVILFSRVYTQVSEPTFKLSESLVESLHASGMESGDYEALLTELEVLQKNPLNLNVATQEDLQKLFFLTPFQINSLLEYRKSQGLLISIYELQVIYGYTDEVIDMMLPFVIVESPEPMKPMDLRKQLKQTDHEIEMRLQRALQKSKGYSAYDSAAHAYMYPGSPWFVNLKYEFKAGDQIRAGVTMEKDAGESFFRGSNSGGFDFNSAYMMVSDMGPLRSAIVGDYRLCFGQGLTLWNSYAPGKSALSMNIRKNQDDIKAFTANDENKFFRGAAFTFQRRNFEISAFYSSKMRDANRVVINEEGAEHFTSLQGSGYHRTPSEIFDEKSVRERAAGGNVNFKKDPLKVGITIVSYGFSKFMEGGDALKDVHDFSGDHLWNTGVDYALNLKNLQFFGEVTQSAHHWGHLHGVLFKANKYATFSAEYRYFQPGFFSLNASAFAESSQSTNEEGFYMGFEVHPVRKITLSGYIDIYHFPWPKFRVSAPSRGNDFLIQAAFKPGKKSEMILKLHAEDNPVDADIDSLPSPVIESTHKTSLRWHFDYPVAQLIDMQSRVEYAVSKQGAMGSKGFMIYQNIAYRLKAVPLSFDFRLAWFQTDDYASRIYAYEHDMATGFSFSPLYDHGLRTYFMATCRVNKSLTCSARISGISYFNKREIGSGSDLLNAAGRMEFKIRIAYRL